MFLAYRSSRFNDKLINMQYECRKRMIFNDRTKKCVAFTFGTGVQWRLQKKRLCSELVQTASYFDSYYRLSRCDKHFDSCSVAVHIPRTKNRLHCFNMITIVSPNRVPVASLMSRSSALSLNFQVHAKDLVAKTKQT